ncbi:MAG: hypothetical protein M0R37_13855 [Bacteroidales bacterium]|nr:hypothetical protein [Bacteroidales bacterium]
MAIRELFARFSFAWDQGTLAKITAASARAEAKVRGVGRAFDGAAQAATVATPALAAAGPAVAQGTAAAGAGLARLTGRLAALRAAWGQAFQGTAPTAAAAALQRAGGVVGGLGARLRELGATWRAALPPGPVQAVTAALAALGAAQRAAGAGAGGFARGIAQGTAAAQQSLARLTERIRGFRAAWWRATAGNALLQPRVQLQRLGLAIGGVVNRLRAMGAAWRNALRPGPAQAATAAVGGLGGALGGVLGSLGLFGGAMGAVFAGRMILSGIKNTFSQVDALAKMAKQLGVSVEALQALDAAANLSGISIEELRVGFTTMTRNLGLFAATGKGRAKDVLSEMGLGIDEIEGRSPDQLFWQFGKAIASIEDPVRRSAFAQRIFGESGARMLSLFRGSAKDIDALKARTEELGVVFGGELAAQIEETNDEMFLAGLQFQRIKVSLLGAVAPALMWIAGRLIHVGQAFGRLTGSSKILQASFVSGGWIAFVKLLGRLLGGVGGIKGALAKLWPTLLAIGRVLLPWIAWALILDDIITFLTGGDSALGRFLDHVFGAGSAKAVLEDLRARWAKIVEWLKIAGAAAREWLATTSDTTKTALAIVGGFLLFASTGIGQLIIRLAVLSAAWLLQAARTGVAAASWAAARVSALALSGSLGAMAAAAGAAAAAIGGIWLAWDQGTKLLEEVGGWEGLLAGVKSLAGGEGLFAGVDAVANAKARAEANKRNRDKAIARADAHGKGYGTRLDPKTGAVIAPEPTLPSAWDAPAAAPLTYTDQRSVTVNVEGGATPAATGRAVAGAVVATQRSNPRGVRAALVGAGRD